MKPFFIPQCENLQVLVNQNALRMIYDGSSIQIDGEIMRYGRAINEVSLVPFFESARQHLADEDWQFFENSRVSDDYCSEYLFQLVACGKCCLCKHRSQVDLINRAAIEQSLYSCPPYFITLTYDNEHLPPYGELRYRDVQNFLKRLRRRWDRKKLQHNMRYIICGEYGSKHGRPHYHMILMNNPYGCDEFSSEHQQLCDDIFICWNMCSRDAFRCEQCQNGAVQYVTKYLAKDKGQCKHFNKPFVRTSIGKGGIGYPAISKSLEYYRSNPSLNVFSYFDADLAYKEIPFGRYLSNHIYPSVSSQVHWSLRRAFAELQNEVMPLMVVYDMITFNDAVELLLRVRPSQFMRIKFSWKKVSEVVGKAGNICHLKKKWKQKVLQPVYEDLLDVLSEVHQDDLDYIIRLDTHRELQSPQQFNNYGSLGAKSFYINSKKSVVTLKEIL